MSKSKEAVLKHDTEIRSRPTTKATVVTAARVGNRVVVVQKIGRWVNVKTSTTTGWVMSKYLKLPKPLTFRLSEPEQSAPQPPDFDAGRIQRGMPVEVFLPDSKPNEEKEQLLEIQSAITNFLEQFEFVPDPNVKPTETIGSWKWLNWFKPTPKMKQEAGEVYDEMKEALRRKHIDVEGATAFEKRANATAAMLKSLEPYENAIVRLGDVIVAKSNIDGKQCLVVETVSPKLARDLEQHPGILNDPKRFIEFVESQPEPAKIEHEKK